MTPHIFHLGKLNIQTYLFINFIGGQYQSDDLKSAGMTRRSQ